VNDTTKRPAVGLRRVSTDRQAKGSDSPYVQDERITEAAARRNRELITIYGSHIEGSSGGIAIAERKDALAAVEHAIKLKAELILDDLSRLGRIADDLEVHGKDMLKRGANIYCIAQNLDWEESWKTAGGRFQIGIQCHLVQYTRDVTAELTCRTLHSRKRNNRRAGGVPFGKMLDPTQVFTRRRNDQEETYLSALVDNMEEQAVIARIKQIAALHTNGRGPETTRIAEIANSEGLRNRTHRGRVPWSATTISRLLRKHQPK